MTHGWLATSKSWSASWLLIGLLSCATVSGVLPAPAPSPAQNVMRAGFAKVDITPVPGYPMGGFAVGGKVAVGVWTRLFARAVYLEDEAGLGLVLVSCDLWAMPAGLADAIAEKVAADPRGRHLGREQLVLAATHTHQSPGNFSSDPFYNAMASPEMGFDRGLFDFLAERIHIAVLQAVESAVPASLEWSTAPVAGLTRNRSIQAFRKNPEAAQISAASPAHTPDPNLAHLVQADAFRAIEPQLTVLTARPLAAPAQVLGVAGFVPVHPTAMGPAPPLYSGDLFGIAALLAELDLDARASAAGAAPVVAIFNGPEGDVSPDWVRQDRGNTLRLGRTLAEAIRQQVDARGQVLAGPIELAAERIEIDELVPGDVDPMVGFAIVGGAEDGWALMHDLGWREGVRDPDGGIPGHGTKRSPTSRLDVPLLSDDMLQFTLEHILRVPKKAWLGVYRIGPLAFATLPGEFTTTLGHRIRKRVGRNLQTGAASTPGQAVHVVLIGLANAYLAYFTTEEEHDRQHYEGASTIFGPGAGKAVGAKLYDLARRLEAGTTRQEELRYRYSVGLPGRFGLDQLRLVSVENMKKRAALQYSLANVIQDGDARSTWLAEPLFSWESPMPFWPPQRGELPDPLPMVSVQAERGGTWAPLVVPDLGRQVPQDSDYFNLVTTAGLLPGAQVLWSALWLAPAAAPATQELRFHVRHLGQEWNSKPFTLEEARLRGGWIAADRSN